MRLYNASELSLENKLPLKLHPHPDKTDIRHLKSNMDGLESKWTVHEGSTGRSKRPKLDDYILSERSQRLKVDGVRKWTFLK